MSDYVGIDYGMGQSNIDKETGIRYGVIPINDLNEWAWESFEADYGPPTCGKCGNEAVEYDEEKHGEYKSQRSEWLQSVSGEGCADYACENCEQFFSSDEAYGEEPVGHVLDDGEYQAFIDSSNDVMIVKSPYYTHAQFCSPCAPGAGHLSNPVKDGPKTYCFGHNWFDDECAPYPVYRVSDGTLVEGKQKEPEVEEGDYHTSDHIHWYQYGKLVLTTADPNDPNTSADDAYKQVKAHMEKEQFWPNCWLCSDHGNYHLINLEEK